VWVSISELVEGTMCTSSNSELLSWKSPFSAFAAERERERNFHLSKWGVFAAAASSSSS
jgi:hypothetical protein